MTATGPGRILLPPDRKLVYLHLILFTWKLRRKPCSPDATAERYHSLAVGVFLSMSHTPNSLLPPLSARLALNPAVLYAVFFLFPFSLTYVPFVYPVHPVSAKTLGVVACAVVGFYSGIVIHRVPSWFISRPGSRNADARYPILTETATFLLAVLFSVGIGMVLLEFYHIGGLPVLMHNVETERFDLAINGYTHLLAVNTGTIAAFLIMISAHCELPSNRWVCLATGIIGIIAVALGGNRSDLLYPIVAILAYKILQGQLKINLKLVSTFLLLVGFLGAIKFYREWSYLGAEYMMMVESQLRIKNTMVSGFLYPIYMMFTYNFTVLDRLVSLSAGGVAHGYFTFYGLVSLLPGHQPSLGEIQNTILGVEFYSVLTSTYISAFYLDFGIPGTYIESLLMGFFYSWLYSKSLNSTKWRIVYAFAVCRFTMLFYTYPFAQFFSYVQLSLAMLFAKSLRWNLPPSHTSIVYSKPRRASG